MTRAAHGNSAVLVAIVLLLVSGTLQGLWTDRWGLPDDMRERDVALDLIVPLRLGDWRGEDLPGDPRKIEQAGALGFLQRRYQYQGQEVFVLLVCGRPRSIAAHPPDMCFQGLGYEMLAAPVRREIGGGSFWHADFRLREQTTWNGVRIFWSWSATGSWLAPDTTRLQFARHSLLYKLYVYRPLAAPDESLNNDPAQELTGILLPHLEKALRGGR